MVYRGKDKPLVQINLADDQEQAFVPTYTSLEQIRGTVSLTAPVDTKIGQIHIGFEGICKTYVEKVATSSPTHGRTEAFHTFLRLGQPIQEAEYPPDHIAKAGETYTFPFIFVVPEQLLPQVCGGHETDNVVHEAHKMPPPTLGDPMTSVWGKSMMDDMAPDMAKISYSIRTRVSGGRESNGKHIIIGDAVRKIRFIPAIAEHPPLMALEGKDGDYRLRQEKKIKKGTLKGKLGTLAMESVQPQSLRLHPPSNKRGCAISTTATINLRFDPATADAEPPRLGSLVTKLKVGTFFSSKALMQIPRRSSEFLYSNTQGLYVDSLQLSSRCVKAVQWIKQTAPDSLPRRESGGSTISNPSLTFVDPSSTYQDKGPYYIARIFVPITLPEKADGNNSNKLFVPTFHSCLVSRVYVLHFYLSCHTPGASIMDPTIHIKIPIQVSAEPNPDAGPTISEDEAQAIARREPAEAPGPLPPRPTYAEAIGSVPPSPSSPGFGQGWWEGAGEPAGRSTESLGLPEGLPDYAVHTAGRLTDRAQANWTYLATRA